MATGIVVRSNPAAANAVDDAISQASGAFRRGVHHVWVGQRFDVDALTLAAVIANAVPGLGVGTAVIPINRRHPLLVASAAQTAEAAAHGNFSLGIGLGGNALEQRAFGITAGKEVTRLREYLTVLRSIRDDGEVDFQGQELTARAPLSPVVAGGRPFPIYVAAMGPRALRAAGELAEGTLTYLAGPRTIEEFIKPTSPSPPPRPADRRRGSSRQSRLPSPQTSTRPPQTRRRAFGFTTNSLRTKRSSHAKASHPLPTWRSSEIPMR
jgi:alkanesulfonate monooxygenase SsuD/methylene tetrahydromethanopterin reductase-like flavin-dependent oxidoreductase (luciferase family)